jgi:hypothetical protein
MNVKMQGVQSEGAFLGLFQIYQPRAQPELIPAESRLFHRLSGVGLVGHGGILARARRVAKEKELPERTACSRSLGRFSQNRCEQNRPGISVGFPGTS